MKASILMSLESTGSRCEQLARHMLIHGTAFDPADMVRRIDAVDAAIGRRRRMASRAAVSWRAWPGRAIPEDFERKAAPGSRREGPD